MSIKLMNLIHFVFLILISQLCVNAETLTDSIDSTHHLRSYNSQSLSSKNTTFLYDKTNKDYISAIKSSNITRNRLLKDVIPSNEATERFQYFLTLAILVDDNSRKDITNLRTKVFDSYSYITQEFNILYVLFTKNPLIISYAKEHNLIYKTNYEVNKNGKPLITSIFTSLEMEYNSTFYGYMGSECFHTSTLIHSLITVRTALKQNRIMNKFAIVGSVYNVNTNIIRSSFNTPYEYTSHIENFCIDSFKNKAYHFDYFIYQHETISFKDICPLTLDEPFFERIISSYCFSHDISIIDASNSLFVVHAVVPSIQESSVETNPISITNVQCINKYQSGDIETTYNSFNSYPVKTYLATDTNIGSNIVRIKVF